MRAFLQSRPAAAACSRLSTWTLPAAACTTAVLSTIIPSVLKLWLLPTIFLQLQLIFCQHMGAHRIMHDEQPRLPSRLCAWARTASRSCTSPLPLLLLICPVLVTLLLLWLLLLLPWLRCCCQSCCCRAHLHQLSCHQQAGRAAVSLHC